MSKFGPGSAFSWAALKRLAEKPWISMPLAVVACILVLAAGVLLPQDTPAPVDDQVTRADLQMISLPKAIPPIPGDPVSLQIIQPVRVFDTSARRFDLSILVRQALQSQGYGAPSDEILNQLLVQTLSEGQPDAYVDAVLDAALARGDISVAPQLLAADGTVDTGVILGAVLKAARG